MHFRTNIFVIAMVASALLFSLKERAWALENRIPQTNGLAAGNLAVAGRLSVDIHAEFMVSRTYDKDTVLNWYNCGYSGGGRGNAVGGSFGDFGFQAPWQERDTKYPHAVTLGKVRAVQFNGANALTGNFPVEPLIAGAQRMALEVWLRTAAPTRDEVVLGWQSKDGGEKSAPLKIPEQIKGSPEWRHLVVNCAPAEETWYLDGRKIAGQPRAMIVKAGHVMVLGGASSAAPSFRGELAAVRLHDGTMTEEQIAHNFQGGVLLGTEMRNWWRTEPDKWFVVESEHFRHCVDKQEMARWSAKQRKEFDDRVPGMLHLAELVYHTYSERLALRMGVVSRRAEKRGNGVKYKIPIQPTDGGSFMGVDDDFGWACQGPGFINPHELVHGCQAMTGGMQGNFWETHANFPQTYNGIYQTLPIISKECAAFPSNGRTYYHDRLMLEHLSGIPAFGPMFISKLWYDGPTAKTINPYPWQAFTEIVPDGWNVLATEWARMVQRIVTYDFPTFDEAQPGKGNTPHGNDGVVSKESRYRKAMHDNARDIQRYARIILAPIPHAPAWCRPPKEQAPQQLGWNICPLQFQPGTVSATLEGYANPERGGDWRAGFVGVDRNGKPVYGGIFAPGKKESFRVGEEIKELYLAVCAVPSKILPIEMVGDFRSPEQEQFPYRVKFEGCSPAAARQMDFPAETKGRPHPNGGGFVADSAHVDPTAFVGPSARILGKAKVLDHARIEDYAVVFNATAKDNAVVSGHAVVEEESVIAGHARVRDFARVTAKSTMQGDARLLEHAVLNSRKTCEGKVTVKGLAHVYGGNQTGTALIDGYYAKGNEITGGKWFTWSWGTGKNPGETNEDFGGLYADCDFNQEHPWMARDAHGATWGYLVNAPRFVPCPDKRVEQRTSAEETVQPSLDRNPSGESNYAQTLWTFIQPEETANYTFWISADDEGGAWIGNAGSDKADRKICGNPFFAGFRDYKKFATQKSPAIPLEKGKRYPLQVVHANAHAAGSLSVSWQKTGKGQPEPIPAACLFTTMNGKIPGVNRRVWNGVGNMNALFKRPDYPTGRQIATGAKALELNGKDQFVELPKDVADLRECAYAADIKWNGRAAGERLFEFANPNGDAVFLCPGEEGKMVFSIRKGGKVESIAAPAIPPDAWTTLKVTLNNGRGALFVNGKKVAQNNAMTLAPEDVRATQCAIGRGLNGGYFGGKIHRFTVFTQAAEEQ